MSLILPDAWLREICDRWPNSGGAAAALAALAGDPEAELAACDFLQETEGDVNPFQVGKIYLICTVTLYYVGRVTAAGFGYIELEDASWVHWTGRLSTLISRLSFTHRAHANRKPRTEYCGQVGLSQSAIVSWYQRDFQLPKEPVE